MDYQRDGCASEDEFTCDQEHAGPFEPKECYEIRFKGHLDDHWANWFHGYCLTREEDGTTTMVALALDQAGLFGLLNKVRDLPLSLISVNLGLWCKSFWLPAVSITDSRVHLGKLRSLRDRNLFFMQIQTD